MKLKTVKLVWTTCLCGWETLTVKIPYYKDNEWIQSLFFELLGIDYDEDFCHYEILEE